MSIEELQVEPRHTDEIYHNDPRQMGRMVWLKKRVTGRAIEVGIGNGWSTDFLGCSAGVEIREDRVNYAKSRFPHIEFMVLDARTEVLDGFDTVVMAEIIEHMEYEEAKEMLSLWGFGGHPERILITTPNAGLPNYDTSLVHNEEHIWFPTGDTVSELVPKGYLIKDMEATSDFILMILERIDD